MLKAKVLTVFFIFAIFFLFFYFDFNQYFTFEFFQREKNKFLSLYQSSPVLFVFVFFAVYVFGATLNIPGAALLTLVAGFIFDFFIGSLVVSLGSTTGAAFCFLISRFLLKDFVQKKFHSKLKAINKGFKKEGAFYCFSLRLIPVFPFFMVNLLMGVTPISLRSFVTASFLGMLPGSLVYVNAGKQLAHIQSPAELFSPLIVLSFLLLAFLPWIMKWILKRSAFRA